MLEEQMSNLQMEEEPFPPEAVLEFQMPTDGYLCPLTANNYGIEFNYFRVRDYETGQMLFEVAKDPDSPPLDLASIPPEMEDQVRCISYDFGSEFLGLQTIVTDLEFTTVAEIPAFRMIERHYFRDFLIKSFDFQLGFCIPNSTNSWGSIYDVPEMPPELIEDMINNPWETQSDSFYYVLTEQNQWKMVMHNKAKYAYSPPPQ